MPIEQPTKMQCFEYLVYKFADWHYQVCPSEDPYLALSKLKLFKLHFFASAVNADKENDGLLNLFDKFYALPYGPVESNVYDDLQSTYMFTITNVNVVRKQENLNYFDEINNYKPILDKAVKDLRSKNENLITYSAMDLVEISHKWYSWKTVFNMARSMNKFSLPIPKAIIKNEFKYFSL